MYMTLPELRESVSICLFYHHDVLTNGMVLLYEDVLFIGPYDLSISLGYPKPAPDPHPDVEQVIQKILAAAHGSGKKW
jgi:hypothetical protein